MKYLLAFILFSFLIVNCNQTESSAHPDSLIKPAGEADSFKYKQQAYRIDTLFQKLYAADAFNGNVLIAKGSDIIYRKSFGYAIKEKNIKLTDTSLFQLASVSKVITGIAVLTLYEKGKLRLDAKVADILPGFPYPEITVQQLLNHRSGLPNYIYFCNGYLKEKKELLSDKELLTIMIENKPKAYLKPDTRFNYCNTNFALLAMIIEKISGKSYSDYLKDEVFTPLGMNHSYTYKTVDFNGINFTHGYTMKYQEVAEDPYDGVLGDKGIYTTTYDLFLLSNALYQNKILSKATQDLAYAPYSPERKLGNYGLGWRMKDMSNINKEVFHNGWWHGYRTSFHRRLNDSLTIIVLSNRLNRSVYSTWRIYGAIDGPSETNLKPESEEE